MTHTCALVDSQDPVLHRLEFQKKKGKCKSIYCNSLFVARSLFDDLALGRLKPCGCTSIHFASSPKCQSITNCLINDRGIKGG